MGLDMYAYKVKGDLPDVMEWTDQEDDDPTHPIREMEQREVEFFYWRKHPNLHGWMERLYNDRGGTKSFNGTYLRLREGDLTNLEGYVLLDTLPPTTGFFFGVSDPEDRIRDMEFIALGRQVIADGYSVYYWSSW